MRPQAHPDGGLASPKTLASHAPPAGGRERGGCRYSADAAGGLAAPKTRASHAPPAGGRADFAYVSWTGWLFARMGINSSEQRAILVCGILYRLAGGLPHGLTEPHDTVAEGGRLRGYPLREGRRGNREGHDQPARAAERLPPEDGGGDDRGVFRRTGRFVDRRGPADRRGSGQGRQVRLLLRRGPEDSWREKGRLRGRTGRAAPERARFAEAHPLDAEGRHRPRRGVRHRRRAGAARGVRPFHRGGERGFRPDGSARRQL